MLPSRNQRPLLCSHFFTLKPLHNWIIAINYSGNKLINPINFLSKPLSSASEALASFTGAMGSKAAAWGASKAAEEAVPKYLHFVLGEQCQHLSHPQRGEPSPWTGCSSLSKQCLLDTCPTANTGQRQTWRSISLLCLSSLCIWKYSQGQTLHPG